MRCKEQVEKESRERGKYLSAGWTKKELGLEKDYGILETSNGGT